MKSCLLYISAALVLALMTPSSGFAEEEKSFVERVAGAKGSPYEAERAKVRKMAAETLDRLYKANPAARAAVEKAVGYGVFSNFGMKIFVAGGGRGKGVVVHNQTGDETFMRMMEIQAGLGLGVKQFSLVWVFDSADAFDRFRNSGWEIGAQATAAAQVKSVGAAYQGAIAVAPGVWLFQLTGSGLALELTAKGTKYYKDNDLNNK